MGFERLGFEVAAGFADVAGVACLDRKRLEAARSVGKILEEMSEGVGRPACSEAGAQIDPSRDFVFGEFVAMGRIAAAAVFAEVRKSAAGEICAVEEASVGAYVADLGLVAWVQVQYAVESPHSDTPIDLASTVGPTALSLYALMCLHIWRNTRRPQGPGRPGYRAQYPPTSRIPLAISKA